MKIILLLIFSVLFLSCNNDTEIIFPVIDPQGLLGETNPLGKGSRNIMNGIYDVVEGIDLFGEQIVLKWSVDKLSIFSGNEGAYGVLKGGRLDSILYFEGYWRFPFNTSTGLLRLQISADSGANSILMQDTTNLEIVVEGLYGSGNDIPALRIILRYNRALAIPPDQDDFEIIAHRGGARNSDYIGASENSLEMIKIATGLGATGVEVDLRMTKDGELFLYHDDDINLRLTRKGPLWGKIEDYTWPQIRSLITLVNGEKIPSLSEALNYILDETEFRTVWLDIKSPAALQKVFHLQKEIHDKAAGKNRKLKVYIGLPTDDVIEKFKELPSYNSLASLCEFGIDIVRELDSDVWGPRWTDGIQLDAVRQMQAESRKVFVWTLDQPAFIQTYIIEGEFDGILSNYTPLVAFYYYINLRADE